MRIALGLDIHLEEFALQHEAQTFRVWGKGDLWRHHLTIRAHDPETEIYFNLTDVDVMQGLLRGAAGTGGGTDWELTQFKGNYSWLGRTVWFRDGVQVDQPEELN